MPTRPSTPVLDVVELTKNYGHRDRVVHAVDHVSFRIERGETLALVGESGSGKSSAARSILHMPPPTSGQVLLNGHDLGQMSSRDLRATRADIQMVFQNPYGSLNPRWPLHELITEPLVLRKVGDRIQRRRRADELLALVGLEPGRFAERRAGQLSGGQAQRVAIARALALSPAVVIFDEALSALDVSIRAQILNLLAEIQRDIGLTSLFIGHDLAVVRHISDRVGVMYLGRIVELADVDDLYAGPAHPYTAALLDAVPEPHGEPGRPTHLPQGEPPNPAKPPSGCHFHPRCPRASQRCADEVPQLRHVAGRDVACHHPLTLADPSDVTPA